MNFQIDLKCMHIAYRWKATKLEILKTQISSNDIGWTLLEYSFLPRYLSVFAICSFKIDSCSLLSRRKNTKRKSQAARYFCARINKNNSTNFICVFDFDTIFHLFIQCEHLCHGFKAKMFCFKSISRLPNLLEYIELYNEINTRAL